MRENYKKGKIKCEVPLLGSCAYRRQRLAHCPTQETVGIDTGGFSYQHLRATCHSIRKHESVGLAITCHFWQSIDWIELNFDRNCTDCDTFSHRTNFVPMKQKKKNTVVAHFTAIMHFGRRFVLLFLSFFYGIRSCQRRLNGSRRMLNEHKSFVWTEFFKSTLEMSYTKASFCPTISISIWICI